MNGVASVEATKTIGQFWKRKNARRNCKRRLKKRSGRHAQPRYLPGLCARLFYRSEEHTSELQSPCNIVCSLLLDKKPRSAGAPLGFLPFIFLAASKDCAEHP